MNWRLCTILDCPGVARCTLILRRDGPLPCVSIHPQGLPTAIRNLDTVLSWTVANLNEMV